MGPASPANEAERKSKAPVPAKKNIRSSVKADEDSGDDFSDERRR